MTKPTLTPVDLFEPLFEDLWLALGPKDRHDYADRCASYHNTLRDLPVTALRAAVEKVKETQTIRALPTPGDLRRRALDHEAAVRYALGERQKAEAEQDPTKCPCGCGGRRWFEVLRDPKTGAVRCYPADVAQSAVTAGAERVPAFRDALDKLAGDPMLRTHMSCLRVPRSPVDLAPTHLTPIGSEDGCPVYDLRAVRKGAA